MCTFVCVCECVCAYVSLCVRMSHTSPPFIRCSSRSSPLKAWHCVCVCVYISKGSEFWPALRRAARRELRGNAEEESKRHMSDTRQQRADDRHPSTDKREQKARTWYLL
jgi:hypothetical protein